MRRISFAAALVAAAPGVVAMGSTGWLEAFGGRPQELAGQEVGARLLLPVHWGTFHLVFHAWNEPAERALLAARKAGIAMVTPRPGKLVDTARPQAAESRWRL
jgi:hypothetical protein